MFCTQCGTQNKEGTRFCRHCGEMLERTGSQSAPGAEPRPSPAPPPSDPLPPYQPGMYVQSAYQPPPAPYPANVPPMAGYENYKSKVVAGILALLFGYLGVHRFYLGYNGIAIAQLLLTIMGLFTCGITTLAACVWAVVDAILLFTDSINRDAAGNPLRN